MVPFVVRVCRLFSDGEQSIAVLADNAVSALRKAERTLVRSRTPIALDFLDRRITGRRASDRLTSTS